MNILVTGCAGFIGFHLTKALLANGNTVVGLDNLNNYYDVSLKKNRLKKIVDKNFTFIKADLDQSNKINEIFSESKFDSVINLAAQAGVRYSLKNPMAYINSNVVGFMNILEACRNYQTKHLIYASSSSVYGMNTSKPFSVTHNVDHPVSLYAASKKSNELMAHTYSHLYGLPTTGLRFFTVYGPWGRPDMALFLFTKAILEGKAIKVFNNGEMQRDFTYIDDIVEGILRLLNVPAKSNPNWNGDTPDPSSSSAPYKIYNIGNNSPVKLEYFISVIESSLGIKANKEYFPIQPGDVESTFADIDELYEAIRFKPKTSIEVGVDNFIKWYKDYYNILN
jgi:UDP-glucuronate 4-epimerase